MSEESKPKTWLSGFWAKVLFEVVIALSLGLIHFLARKILPKRWRPRAGAVKQLADNVSEVTNNFPHEDDDYADLINKAQHLFDMAYDKFNQATTVQQDFAEYIQDISEDLEIVHDHYFAQQVLPHIEEYAEKHVFHKYDPGVDMLRLVFDTKQYGVVSLYMIGNADGQGGHNYDGTFAVVKGTSHSSLLNLLFEKHDNRLYLSIDDEDGSLVCATLDHQLHQDDYILDVAVFDEIKNEIERFKKRGKQRSYLLNGPPGTGKTSFCLELSSKMSGKILKIDSTVFIRLSSMSIRAVVENLDADFIIVDDIDRITSSDLPAFFYCLEAVKNYKRKPTLLATCNNIYDMDLAIIRPGRFDDIKEFNAPSKTQRRVFLSKLVAGLEIPMTPEQLDQFVKATAGMTQAYLKEYAMQLKADCDFQDVLKKIKCRQKYLKNVDVEDLERHQSSVRKVMNTVPSYKSKPVALMAKDSLQLQQRQVGFDPDDD